MLKGRKCLITPGHH